VQSPYADLRASRTVNDPDATNLTAILLAGSNAPLPVEHAFMPPFARDHSDDELAAVANLVNGFFGNGAAKVTAADIDKARRAWSRPCLQNCVAWVTPRFCLSRGYLGGGALTCSPCALPRPGSFICLL
jgi:hypothetical protein